MKSIRTNPRSGAPEGDERIRTAVCAPSADAAYDARVEQIARSFHEAYERLAPEYGYRTREASAVPWVDVPEANRRLMCAVVRELLERGAVS